MTDSIVIIPTYNEKENVENSKISVKIGQLFKVERPIKNVRK